ncbi:hypothetical protein BCY88_15320 [Paraburkholderia fungorum]|uniref:Uncharacterized protein n=1 Tax=Paraburkholderia fungorum TaxID=134537 RepID=A0A420GYA3_9BURK|nr:hypothetical protein BCY88_15320 [Paraburkholderia fungorum]
MATKTSELTLVRDEKVNFSGRPLSVKRAAAYGHEETIELFVRPSEIAHISVIQEQCDQTTSAQGIICKFCVVDVNLQIQVRR